MDFYPSAWENLIFHVDFNGYDTNNDMNLRILTRINEYNWDNLGKFDVVFFEHIDFDIISVDGNEIYLKAVDESVHMNDDLS